MASSRNVVVFRTPKDDAPPYDPSLWEGGRDCFFLTRRTELQLLERRLQQSNDAVDQHAPKLEDVTKKSVTPAGPSKSMFSWEYIAEVFAQVILRRPPKPKVTGPTAAEVAALSFDELFLRFQSALQRGDVVESSCYAKELAKRKAQVARAPTTLEGGGDGAKSRSAAPLAPSQRYEHATSSAMHGFGRL
jgi:hypothetical protein